jgi:hypothetical protein
MAFRVKCVFSPSVSSSGSVVYKNEPCKPKSGKVWDKPMMVEIRMYSPKMLGVNNLVRRTERRKRTATWIKLDIELYMEEVILL